ncbi:unnamed protein product [Anisakis simplex]|uniref:30S ribosomal protein S20 n=1 Tax=Anisakis simplex TaxID=6269 RepID=A0A0M3JKP6_ANISI|nr:unnamed protein product [Anisakis simplex]
MFRWEKLSELQQTLMNVLTKKGILQSYDRERVRRKKRDVNGAIVRRANKLRSFSAQEVGGSIPHEISWAYFCDFVGYLARPSGIME